MRDITKELPTVGKRVLCWFEERNQWVIDYTDNLSPSDGGGVNFVCNYNHNYTHWTELPPSPIKTVVGTKPCESPG